MYVLPDNAGEYHRVGSQVMKRIARREDTGDVHEFATFTGNTGAAMPRHAHLSSHAALLVMRGEIELEVTATLDDDARRFRQPAAGTRMAGRWIPTGPARAVLDESPGWGGVCRDGRSSGRGADPLERVRTDPGGALVRRPQPATSSLRLRRLRRRRGRSRDQHMLPVTPGAYVLADGGGERFGGNTFLARNANTLGAFLFIITEGGPKAALGGVFHARHFRTS